MPKKPQNAPKGSEWEKTYELPRDLDFSKLRVVGVGLESLRKHAAAKDRLVKLEPDVAKAFPTAKAVNDGLRTLQRIRLIVRTTKRRKSA